MTKQAPGIIKNILKKKTKSNHIENIKTIEIIVFIELSPSDIGLAGSLKGIPGYLELPKHLMTSW